MFKLWKKQNVSTVLYLFHVIVMTTSQEQHPSCFFNPLCTCSKVIPNLGIVTCTNVELPRLPVYLNRSKVNSLNLENNGIKIIEPYFLSGTGLYSLKVSKNPVFVLNENVFKGLEYSLRDLELSYLGLIEAPQKAMMNLQKLRILNLEGNDISDINIDTWITIRNTLEILILRDNALTYIPKNTFERFNELKILDLSNNIIYDIDPDAFFPLTSKLLHLFLSNNQLHFIPFAQLLHLRSLKTLDLSYNYVSNVNAVAQTIRTTINSRFSLNILDLKYNQIKILTPESFQKFAVLNRTVLDGNPISVVQESAFRGVSVTELSLNGCGLSQFESASLKGLEKSLQLLDLSNNVLSTLHPDFFKKFENLQELRVMGNDFRNVSVMTFDSNLFKLDFGGSSRLNKDMFFRDLSKIKSLISLSVANVVIPHLTPNDFVGYGFGVEELAVTNANMKTIKAQAFIHVRGIKKLDLSDNNVYHVDENAFVEVGHSLLTLFLSHTFSSSVKIFPMESLKHLKSLKFLDASNNDFEELPVESFYNMRLIETIRLNDCKIKEFFKDTFISEIHLKLKELSMSYNYLTVLKSNTFTDLPELRYLNLEDNRIKKIESRVFVNLKNLTWLYLRGNQIEIIDRQAFVNLPKLEILDLAFNKLVSFDFFALDQVGSLTSLKMNLSFNSLLYLEGSAENEYMAAQILLDTNLKILDLSYNHIYDITYDYLTPVENCITHLYLSHNQLMNISYDTFGGLEELQFLDLSFNRIRHIDGHLLKNIVKLQVLNLSRNEINNIPTGLFQAMKCFRIADLSHNRLKFLPEFLFRDDVIEKVTISHNQLPKIPFNSFSSEAANTLRELDLSNNLISSVHFPDLISRFQSLISLDIAYNRLHIMEKHVFKALNNLLYLDLSRNSNLKFADKGESFHGLQNSLLSLNLKNISLNTVPILPLAKLINLKVSENNITEISPEAVLNLTSLRSLDLSNNNLPSIPVVILPLKSLKYINLSNNKINLMTNNTLLNGFQDLRELDISDLPLDAFEAGALSGLISLATLHLSVYRNVDHFNIPSIIQQNLALQNLHIKIQGNTNLQNEMKGMFPKKLENIVISGKDMQDLHSSALMGVTSPTLKISLFNTSVSYIGADVFKNAYKVRNISMDVRNNSLRQMENPSTGNKVDLFNRTFLIGLSTSNNNWLCECEIGWIEQWSRRKRQLLCRYIESNVAENLYKCHKTDDDLRSTYCGNENNLLLDEMKTNLECSWGNNGSTQIRSSFIIIGALLFIFLAKISTIFRYQ